MMVVGLVGLMMTASLLFAAGGGSTPTTTTGTVPSNMAMIVSSKALESYAKEQVAQAVSYGGSEGIILPDGRTVAQVVTNNPDIRVIQQLLGREVLSFRVADPNANQYFGAQLMDANGYCLFTGWNLFRLQKDYSGNWQVPPGAANVSTALVDPVPIRMPGASYAYAVVTDANGNRQYVSFQVQNDYLFFPKSLAGLAGNGWSGQMVISVSGSAAVYDMGSGNPVPTVPVESAVQAGIDGLVTLDNPGQIVSNPQSVNGQGVNPLYQIKISGVRRVGLRGMTTEGEEAVGVYIRGAGSEPVYCPITPGQMLHMTFDAIAPGAVWDIWFVYPNFGNDEPSIPPNNGGVGMG